MPALEETLMMDPPPARRMDGVTLLMPSIVPMRFTSITRRNFSRSWCSMELKSRMPALLTSTVTGPKRSSASATAAIHSSSAQTSRCR